MNMTFETTDRIATLQMTGTIGVEDIAGACRAIEQAGQAECHVLIVDAQDLLIGSVAFLPTLLRIADERSEMGRTTRIILRPGSELADIVERLLLANMTIEYTTDAQPCLEPRTIELQS